MCSCGRDPDDVSHCQLMPFDEAGLRLSTFQSAMMMMQSSGWQTLQGEPTYERRSTILGFLTTLAGIHPIFFMPIEPGHPSVGR